MPPKFDRCRRQGGKVRTVTKGSAKGRLICIKGSKTVLGHKRGHSKGGK